MAQGVLDNRQSCLNKVYFAFALNKLYKLYEIFSRTLLFLHSLLYSLLYSFCNVATLRISEYLLILPPPPHEPRDREIPTQLSWWPFILFTVVSQLRLGPCTMSFFFHSWTWGYMETYGSTSVEHTFSRNVEKGKTQILE